MVANCLKCKKIFNKINVPICPDCIKKEEELFDEVRLLIKDNPLIDIDKVIEDTGVTKRKLIKWIKEDKLVLELHGADALSCSKCGKPLTHGKICKKCANRMQETVNIISNSMKKEKPKTNVIRVTKRER